MRYLIEVSLVLVILPSLVMGCAGPSATTVASEGLALQQRSASLVITPVSGKPETRITIFGAGFVPGEEVKVEVTMAGVSILLGVSEAAHIANESGAIKIASSIPQKLVAKAGLYTVIALGEQRILCYMSTGSIRGEVMPLNSHKI